MKRRPTEPRMRTVVRLLALLCKRIDRLEEQLRAIEMLIIYGRRTCPNAPMIDGYCVSKCDCRCARVAELADAPNKQPVFISTCVLLEQVTCYR